MPRFEPVELYPGCPETFAITDGVNVSAQALAWSAKTHERIADDMWNKFMAPETREYHMKARLDEIVADAEIFQLLGHDEETFPKYQHKQGA